MLTQQRNPKFTWWDVMRIGQQLGVRMTRAQGRRVKQGLKRSLEIAGGPIAAYGARKVQDYLQPPTKKPKTIKKKNMKRSIGFVRQEASRSALFVRKRSYRSKRRKRSLSKRVHTLEKLKVKDSKRQVKGTLPFKVSQPSGVCQATMWDIGALVPTHIEDALTSMGGASAINFTAENTKVLVKNIYVKFTYKNNSLAPCVLKSQFLLCSDDTNRTPIDDWVLYTDDRQGGSIGAAAAQAAETATASLIPKRKRLNWDVVHYPIFEAFKAKGSHFKGASKISQVILSPGAEATFIYKRKSMTYAPEYLDQASVSHLSGQTLYHMGIIYGTLSHDDTNNNKVGISNAALDCYRTYSFDIVYSDGKGLNDNYDDNRNTTLGFTAATQATEAGGAIDGDVQ